MRINYISSKEAGKNTSVSRNTKTFDAYIIGNITLGAYNIVRGTTIQLVCNNIFNKIYYSPGIGVAGGVRYPDQIMQMGRTFFLKLSYEF
jgi:outer membrane receptor protein involved in Fe transport